MPDYTPSSGLRRGALRVFQALSGLSSTLISAVLLLAIWEFSVDVLDIPSYVLPRPIAVWRALVAGLFIDPTLRSSYLYQLVNTLEATLLGFAIASVSGIGLAAAMGEIRWVKRLILPYVIWLQSLPKIAIAPLFVIWFGYQLESKVAMAATITLFPILLNSLEGFETVEHERLELLKSLDASRLQGFWLVKLPSALPFIFAGLSLGIVYSLLGALISEFLGAQRGMGVTITQLQSVSDTAGVFAALVILAVASSILIAIVQGLKRRIVFWSGEGRTARHSH